MQSGEPLGLDAEHHDDVRLRQRSIEVALNGQARPHRSRNLGQKRKRARQQHSRAQTRKQQRVRARNAAMEDVAADGDGYARKCLRGGLGRTPAQHAQEGAEIEQRLRRVLVCAVAGV